MYSEDTQDYLCFYCGKSYQSNASCKNGHFICDSCHTGSANDLIEKYCSTSNGTNPIMMAVTLMHNPALKMHGPEHHFLVPAVLLAAYYNLQHSSPEEKESKISVARKRSEDIKGGFCGFCVACGAGIGTGIFVSIITHATPLSKVEWKLSNQMTAKSLQAIAERGGPRCCMHDTFLAIMTAVVFLQKELETTLPIDQHIKCTFTSCNKECHKEECLFFEQPAIK
jgi:hypothetical protein